MIENMLAVLCLMTLSNGLIFPAPVSASEESTFTPLMSAQSHSSNTSSQNCLNILEVITSTDINIAAEPRTLSVEGLRHFTCGASAANGERMFRCELCQSIVPAGTRSTKVILVTRDKTYDERGGGGFAARGGFRKRGPGRGGSSPKKDYDKGGEGQEIVREVSVCPKCAETHRLQQEAESLKANEGAE